MNTPARLPGTALAIGAFCLTLLLGLGTASAFGLWQQSSTATMTIKAGSWLPTVAIGCTNGLGQGSVVLSITTSEQPSSLSINAKKNGTAYPLTATSLAAGTTTVTLTPLLPSYITATGVGNRDVSVQVTAGFPIASATAEWTTLRIYAGGTKIACT
jgi:hypothetical protein